jgi:hypothetical protein
MQAARERGARRSQNGTISTYAGHAAPTAPTMSNRDAQGEGSGLGLAVVSRITQRHQVGLSLRNNVGHRGLQIWVLALLRVRSRFSRDVTGSGSRCAALAGMI